MAQQLIAINGNEEFPYTLTPNDISEAMGFTSGIAPGGFNTNGVITLPSGSSTLTDAAWNNAIQINSNVTSINMPTSNPINAIMHFYNTGNSNSENFGTWTLNVTGTNQYFYFLAGGIVDGTTSIVVPYNSSLVLLSRGTGEIDIIGGSYLLTNNTEVNNFLGGLSTNPSNFIRNYFSSKNMLTNGSWMYGENTGWTYSSSLNGNYDTGINANNIYLNLNTANENVDFTITSDNIAILNNIIGFKYVLSAMVYNNLNNSSVTDTSNPITVSVNFYNSSDTLIETQTMFTCPSNTFWSFYNNSFIITSGLSETAYFTVTISGTTASSDNNMSFSQFKLELANGFLLPSLYSDESSITVFSNNNLSTTGYQKLPSGVIVQWGEVTNTGQSGSTPATVNFPLAFPNSCFQVIATDGGSNAYRYWASNYTTTGFDIGAMSTDASGTPVYVTSGDATAHFIAFGW